MRTSPQLDLVSCILFHFYRKDARDAKGKSEMRTSLPDPDLDPAPDPVLGPDLDPAPIK